MMKATLITLCLLTFQSARGCESITLQWLKLAYNITANPNSSLSILPGDIHATIAELLTIGYPEQTIDNALYDCKTNLMYTFPLPIEQSNPADIFTIVGMNTTNTAILYTVSSLKNEMPAPYLPYRWTIFEHTIISGKTREVYSLTTHAQIFWNCDPIMYEKTLIMINTPSSIDGILKSPHLTIIDTHRGTALHLPLINSFPLENLVPYIGPHDLACHKILPLCALHYGSRGDILIYNLAESYTQLEHPIVLQTRTGEVHTRVFNIRPKIWRTMQKGTLKEESLDIQRDWNQENGSKNKFIAWHPYEQILAQIFKGILYVWKFDNEKRLIHYDRMIGKNAFYKQVCFSAMGDLITRSYERSADDTGTRKLYEHYLDGRPKQLLKEENSYLCGAGINTICMKNIPDYGDPHYTPPHPYLISKSSAQLSSHTALRITPSYSLPADAHTNVFF